MDEVFSITRFLLTMLAIVVTVRVFNWILDQTDGPDDPDD